MTPAKCKLSMIISKNPGWRSRNVKHKRDRAKEDKYYLERLRGGIDWRAIICLQENRLLLYKGFGEKTQDNIRESIEFYLQNQGNYLYAQIESYAHAMNEKLSAHFTKDKIALTGSFRRQMETIDVLEWCATASSHDLKKFFLEAGVDAIEEDAETILTTASGWRSTTSAPATHRSRGSARCRSRHSRSTARSSPISPATRMPRRWSRRSSSWPPTSAWWRCRGHRNRGTAEVPERARLPPRPRLSAQRSGQR